MKDQFARYLCFSTPHCYTFKKLQHTSCRFVIVLSLHRNFSGATMAWKSTNLWKSLVNRVGASPYATTTTSKLRSGYAPAAEGPSAAKRAKRHGDFVPVYVAVGMIMLAGAIGIHTAAQQLARSPAVRVKKSRRESFPEVEEPEHVAEESQRFMDKSFFRKVAHIQEFNSGDTLIPDTIRKDVYGRKHNIETLKSVGIESSRQT